MFSAGLPLFDQEPLGLGDSGAPVKKSSDRETIERSPSQIVFVKSRMLYARAALSTRGLVHFGLRHIRRTTATGARQRSRS